MDITIGWWLLPVVATAAAWVPFFRFKPVGGGYFPDWGGLFIGAGSLIASLFIWLVYFATLWAVS